jgi:hypothetical protein
LAFIIGSRFGVINLIENSKKEQAKEFPQQLTINGTVFGTCHGLAKLPYVRDTRRSIGIQNFVMNVHSIFEKFDFLQLTQITGNATHLIGYNFPDRVLILLADF